MHDKRIDFLVRQRYGGMQLENSPSAVINLSNYQLTKDELFTLKLGLNFCIPPTKVSREQIAAEMEMLYAQACNKLQPKSNTALKALKARLHDLTYGYAGSVVDRHDVPLLRNHRDAVRSLRDNEQILISKPDKGTGVVVLDRSSYFTRIENEILSDGRKFTKIGQADMVLVTKQSEKEIRDKIDQMYKQKLIGIELQKSIKPTGSRIPLLYGLPKVHKPTAPFRPILSMVNAPQEKLAKWLLRTIEPAVDYYTKYCVKDSFSFAKEVQSFSHVNLDTAYMVSYDVSSLFTNVPVMEAIEITTDYLFKSGTAADLTISRHSFEALMQLATVGVKFVFGGNLYEQVDGVAMGSPLGPALANIFLGFYEAKLFAHCKKQPLYYKRYVDDTFVIFDQKDDAQDFLLNLNSLHASLTFTTEEETNSSLPFLDVLVQRDGASLVTSVYRKKTFTGEYMKWNSFSPVKRKINLIHTLTWRALSICSPCNVNNELSTIKSILVKNGYPQSVVETHVAKTVSKFGQNSSRQSSCPLYVKLPWIGSRSIAFEQQIKKSVRACFADAEVRASYTTRPLMSFKLKDVIPTLLRSKVIYQFQCLCEERYVGRTEQRLMERVKQHVPSAIRNPSRGRPLPDVTKQKSAIAKHLCESGPCREAYQDNWFSVLDTARSSFHLSTLEASYISSQDPTLCRQKQFVYTLKVFK